jgi:hypothetical protein
MGEQNKHDVFNWIKKVIDSCKTIEHFNYVKNLNEIFLNRFNDYPLTKKLFEYRTQVKKDRKKDGQ